METIILILAVIMGSYAAFFAATGLKNHSTKTFEMKEITKNNNFVSEKRKTLKMLALTIVSASLLALNPRITLSVLPFVLSALAVLGVSEGIKKLSRLSIEDFGKKKAFLPAASSGWLMRLTVVVMIIAFFIIIN